jgi:hypothetical protein
MGDLLGSLVQGSQQTILCIIGVRCYNKSKALQLREGDKNTKFFS